MVRNITIRLIGVALGFLITPTTSAWAATKFSLDPSHTSVGFSIRHMLISTVRGSFSGIGGEIVYDPDDPTRSSVRVEIDAASIDTGNKDRDNHLKGPDFFDVENYPKIIFESTKVEKRGDNWVAYGKLTIKGVTREIAIPFRLNGPIKDPWGNLRIGVEAETITLNRQDFGISWNQVLDAGGLAVGNEVSVYIAAEAAAQTP